QARPESRWPTHGSNAGSPGVSAAAGLQTAVPVPGPIAAHAIGPGKFIIVIIEQRPPAILRAVRLEIRPAFMAYRVEVHRVSLQVQPPRFIGLLAGINRTRRCWI